jgi:hypothetical protein
MAADDPNAASVPQAGTPPPPPPVQATNLAAAGAGTTPQVQAPNLGAAGTNPTGTSVPVQAPNLGTTGTQPNINFALSPAWAQTSLLDYNSKAGSAIFRSNTAPLEPVYDLNPADLSAFLQKMQRRSRKAAWQDNMVVPVDGQGKDFFTRYGTISLEDCQIYAATYSGQPTRLAQNAYQIATCLEESLTDSAIQKVETRSERYMINGSPDGLCLLKCIIIDGAIDTRYTTLHIKEKLQQLHSYMIKVEHDIPVFNTEVKLLEKSLIARGETPVESDMLLNLFNGYKANADANFHKYILKNYEEYVDGDRNFTTNQLMTRAENKYKQLKQDEVWMKPNEQQEQIVALTATIQQLKDKPASTSKPAKKETKGPRGAQYPPWKLAAPAAGASQTKTSNGRTYHWCPNHQLWTAHKPVDCTKPPASSTPNNSEGLQATSLAAITQSLEEDDDWDE